VRDSAEEGVNAARQLGIRWKHSALRTNNTKSLAKTQIIELFTTLKDPGLEKKF